MKNKAFKEAEKAEEKARKAKEKTPAYKTYVKAYEAWYKAKEAYIATLAYKAYVKACEEIDEDDVEAWEAYEETDIDDADYEVWKAYFEACETKIKAWDAVEATPEYKDWEKANEVKEEVWEALKEHQNTRPGRCFNGLNDVKK